MRSSGYLLLTLGLMSQMAFGQEMDTNTCGTWEEVLLPWTTPSVQASFNRNKRNLVGCFPSSEKMEVTQKDLGVLAKPTITPEVLEAQDSKASLDVLSDEKMETEKGYSLAFLLGGAILVGFLTRRRI